MRRRHLRRALLGLIVATLLLGGGFFILRDASVFEIKDVAVVGVSGPDAPRVQTALENAARDMTTLNVSGAELREAAHRFPTVKTVEVDRDLPNGVTLTVHEKRPVAVVEKGGRRVPLAADGRLLQGATAPENLPALSVGNVAGPSIGGTKGRQLVALVAAAPDALRKRAAKAELDRQTGLTLEMDKGPDLYFGTAGDLHAKWKAAARVLADPTAEGATYIDVRVPERAAAGGLAPLVQPDAEQEVPAPGAVSPSIQG